MEKISDIVREMREHKGRSERRREVKSLYEICTDEGEGRKCRMSNVSYRVCDSSGYAIYDSLADMDAFLSRKIKRGSLTFAVPIKKIEKVTIEDVPLTKVVMRYNEKVEKEKTEGETK